MCICFLAENIFFRRQGNFSYFFILASISTIPFKLSGIFILFLVLAYLLSFRNFKVWGKTALVGLLVLTPFLIKNYITTGYPLFPSSFSIGSPDWQLPKEMASGLGDYIMNVNKFYNYQVSFVNQQEITTFNWIPFWSKTVLIQHKVLLALSICALILFFYNPVRNISHQKIRLLIGALSCMMVAWFFTAPDPRFAFSFILFLAFFPIALFIGRFVYADFFYQAFVLSIIPLLLYASAKARPIHQNNNLVLHVMDIETPVHKTITIDNIPLHITRMDSIQWLYPCAFSELPCMGEINQYVRPRGKKIGDGFYMNPKPDSSFIRNYNY